MPDKITPPHVTDEQLQLFLQLESIFMPRAKTQRDAAHARLKESGIGDEQLRFVHYTSADAALKIIGNRRLWMRNTTCMADYSEVRHGYDMLHKVFSDTANASTFISAVDACAQGAAQEAFKRFDGWWKQSKFDIYVTSISEHDKRREDKYGRLSMWRAFGSGVRVALVIKVPKMSQAALALGLIFSPVAYLSESEVNAVIQEVIQNIGASCSFLRSVNRDVIVRTVLLMLVAAVTCLKHEVFQEEREWRALYIPKIQTSPLMESSTEVVIGVPQLVYKIPLDAKVSPTIAPLDLSQIFDRLIIGPTPYPWVVYDAFNRALDEAGVPPSAERVWVSNIPIRT
jgi:hypothetical protein